MAKVISRRCIKDNSTYLKFTTADNEQNSETEHPEIHE